MHIFGWDDPQQDFQTALSELLAVVDAAETPVHIVGVSAGGSAALHLLANRPERVRSIATVASPHRSVPRYRHPLLMDSLAQLETIQLDPSKVISFYGFFDELVPPRYSRSENIRQVRVPAIGHRITIAVTLTLLAHKVGAQLKR